MDLTQEAENSLEELDLKRKLDDQVGHAGRKPKRMKMGRLEGRGVGTSPEEEVMDGRDDQLAGLGSTRQFYCNSNSRGAELQGIGQILSPLEFYCK